MHAFFQIYTFAYVGFRSSSSFVFSAISSVISSFCFGFAGTPFSEGRGGLALGLDVVPLFALIGRAMSLVATGGGRFETLALGR